MSGFVALVNLNGTVPDISLVARMSRHIDFRGEEPPRRVSVQGGCFVHAAYRSTRYAEFEVQPLVCERRKCVVLADARIDDRQRLVDDLRSHSVFLPASAPDAELILAAYESWGEDLCARLLGDFSFVIWDWANRSLLTARDRFGMRALYYTAVGPTILISNQIAALLAHPEVSGKLDELALADFLLFGNVNELDARVTPYSAIRSVGLAEQCLWQLDRPTTARRYWTLSPDPEPFQYRNDDEVTSRFRELMKIAVHDRVQARSVMCALSGGLDSTTMAFFVAELFKEGDGPDLVCSLTAANSPDHPEAVLASKVAKYLGIEHRVRLVRRESPLAAVRSTPFPNTDLYDYQVGTLCEASELARVSLIGHAADYLMAPDRMTVREMLSVMGMKKTIDVLRTLRTKYSYRPALGLGLVKLFRRQIGRAPKGGKMPGFPGWIRPQFRDSLDLKTRWAEYWLRQKTPGDHRLRPMAQSWLLSYNHWSMRDDDWHLPFTPTDAADPFLDLRLLEFLWSIPPLPWFHKKHLIREAMKGRLPAEIVSRPKTPLGRWLQGDLPSVLLKPWLPREPLSDMIDAEKLPDLSQGLRRTDDIFPLFLNAWLERLDASMLTIRCD